MITLEKIREHSRENGFADKNAIDFAIFNGGVWVLLEEGEKLEWVFSDSLEEWEKRINPKGERK